MLIENNDSFLSELTRMFNLSREPNASSLYITMKKYRQKIADNNPNKNKDKNKSKKKLLIKDKPKKSEIKFADDDNKCIIRAKFANKKISTIISSKDLEKFQSAYSSLLRGNLYGLKDKRKIGKKNETATKPNKSSN